MVGPDPTIPGSGGAYHPTAINGAITLAGEDTAGPEDPPAGSLDISPFVRAVDRLREGFDRHCREPDDDQLRDGLIQRFEFTYELSHRMLRRYLRQVSASPASFDAMPFQDLIRTGNEQGVLLGDWPVWRRYRDMRARTSHAYAAAIAEQVALGIPDFLVEATHLRDELLRRLG